MRKKKTRILMDMSLALMGYSGIPQDTRLLYKTLASCPDVEVTGMLYSTFASRRRHKFESPLAPRADVLANQARFLWSCKEPAPSVSGNRWLRLAQNALRLATILGTRRGDLMDLDTETFWPVMWRTLFAQTLSADDLHLVQNGRFKLLNVAGTTQHARTVLNRAPIRIDTRGYDFLIVQTARPFRVSAGTRKIVRYHDMIPVMHSDTTPHEHDILWHNNSIRHSLDSTFVCNSDPTQHTLVEVYPQLAGKAHTIPYMLSDQYRPEANPGMVKSIFTSRRSMATGAKPRTSLKKMPRYIMSVSTLEPRKNFPGLIEAFNAVRFRESIKREMPGLKLVIVGGPGWKSEPILNAMREFVRAGDVIHLEKVTAEELRVLYTHAEAFVFPSHAEGFGFPPVEAMQCKTPVIASDIPEHRWVMGDAALYCSSYDVNSIADAIERLLASKESPALRSQLVARGLERVQNYTQERCSQDWLDLLDRLQGGPAAAHEEGVRLKQVA